HDRGAGDEESQVLGGRDSGAGRRENAELQRRRQALADGDRVVRGPVVDDDDLVAVVGERLPGQALERRSQEVGAAGGRDHGADGEAGVGHAESTGSLAATTSTTWKQSSSGVCGWRLQYAVRWALATG